uniref:G-protein coupled receptors family 1 profile domain-containing protein n=1 Tax=Rhodnius prolixus TaxID=13249 RepID=T1HVS4_RHOPR
MVKSKHLQLRVYQLLLHTSKCVLLPVRLEIIVEPFKFEAVILYETCIERWPSQELKVAYAVCVLMIQAVIPALVVGCIHAKIASYLNAHAKTQRDSKRAQRELQRNKRTTLLLSDVK